MYLDNFILCIRRECRDNICLGIVRVFMEYDGRDFKVQISGETESAEGYDNYQYSEILDKIEDLNDGEIKISDQDIPPDDAMAYAPELSGYKKGL